MAVLEKRVPAARSPERFTAKGEPLAGAFFWLSAFYVAYCARPEDWIPGVKYLPLAKISGIFALLALLMTAGRSKRGFRDLPREAGYLVGIVSLLFVSALLSPVWRGGAFLKTLDFSKALIAWILTFLLITNFARLRRIIFIQSASVAVIAVVSLLKGRSLGRLQGAIGGIYSNSNDLAFAIVLTLPFCFAFMLSTRSIPRKAEWVAAMLVMCMTLFMTGSRGGFIDLVVTGAVCLWVFAVKGKRIHLIVVAAVMVLVVGLALGGRVKSRFLAISGSHLHNDLDVSAYSSYEQRRLLIIKSLQGIARYPLGIGAGNFEVYSGTWREVHVAYLQIAVEGGICAFVLYMLFFARGFSNLRRLRRLQSHDPEMDLFSGALYATLIGFVVGAFFAPEAYQYFPYFAVAYTSALLAIAKEREPKEIPPPELAIRSQRGWRTQARTGELAPVRGGLSKTPGSQIRHRR
jgi:O-Antigen ligase